MSPPTEDGISEPLPQPPSSQNLTTEDHSSLIAQHLPENSDGSDSSELSELGPKTLPTPPRWFTRTRETPSNYGTIENTAQASFGVPKRGLAKPARSIPLVHGAEPCTYKEAVICPEASRWITAMQEQRDSLREMQTWKLVTKPAHHSVPRGK